MNAHTPFGALLHASYDHHGIKLDLYGELGQDGYEVKHVCIPATTVTLTEAVSEDALEIMCVWCDDHLPTSEQLVKASRDEQQIERGVWARAEAQLPELTRI